MRTEDNWNILPNLNVQTVYNNNNEILVYRLYPANGYVLHIPDGDEPIYDEQGNKIGTQPYYTYGGASVERTYDFATNPRNYHADLYEEGMTVYGGGTKPDHEIM